jgi:hypothetical protein
MNDTNFDDSDDIDSEYHDLKTKYVQLKEKLKIQKKELEAEIRRKKLLEEKQRQEEAVNFLAKNKIPDKLEIFFAERKNPVVNTHPNIKLSCNLIFEKQINIFSFLLGVIYSLFSIIESKFRLEQYFIPVCSMIVLVLLIIFVPNWFLKKFTISNTNSFNDILVYNFSYNNKEQPQNLTILISDYLFKIYFDKNLIVKVPYKYYHLNDLIIDYKNSFIGLEDIFYGQGWLMTFNTMFTSLTNFLEADLKKKTTLLEQELLETTYMISKNSVK